MDGESKFSILERYGENYTEKEYITNPAIGRDQQIKELLLILLTPEKSAILVGKPGIGKTAIVEGLAYAIQRKEVPDALVGYTIINIKTASLLGTMPSGESKVQKMIDELKLREKIILFVDEIHMLIGATDSSSLDFAKPEVAGSVTAEITTGISLLHLHLYINHPLVRSLRQVLLLLLILLPIYFFISSTKPDGLKKLMSSSAK